MSNSNQPLALGQEYLQSNESAIVAEMIAQMKVQLTDMYAHSPTLRQVHSKMHGCVKAEFIVDANLPQEYRVGVFKVARTFPAWIRFSNGVSKVQADGKKDTRGMAIKIMDVPGDKILDIEKNAPTQDFIFASAPIFFAKNLKDFHGLMTASISKSKLAVPLYFVTHPVTAIRTVTKLLNKAKHPFGIPYYSISPYRFGDDTTKAVKYCVRPSEKNKLEHTNEKDYNFLRKNMVATLVKQDVYFDFFIQFQTDAEKMPIEDGTVEWKSPFIKLATIRIPMQEFDNKERDEFGEDMTYNAWHSLPQHCPLGGFNRGRKVIYRKCINSGWSETIYNKTNPHHRQIF